MAHAGIFYPPQPPVQDLIRLTKQTRERFSTAYRENYLAAQRSPSAGNSPDPLPQALHRAQRWTAGVPWGGLATTTEALARRNAFATEAELDDLGLRLLDGPGTEHR